MMPSNRRKQVNPTKSVHNIEPDDKAGPSSGSPGDKNEKEVEYREVILKMGRGIGYYIKNFIYIKNRECHGKIFLRCQHRTTCSARAYIKVRSKRAIVTQSYHPHPPPNHKTIEFKTTLPTKKGSSSAGKSTPKRTSPRKATAVKSAKEVQEEDEPESEKKGEEETAKLKRGSPSSDECETKVSPPVRERSQRVRKLPARLREDPSPIPFIGKRKKKKKLLILPPRQRKKKVKPIETKPEPVKVDFDVPSEASNVDSDSDNEDSDEKDMSDSSPGRSPGRSPSRSPRQNRSPRKGSPGSSSTSPKSKDQKSALEILRQLTYAALESEPDVDEDNDDMVVNSDDDDEEKPKVFEKKEPKQRTILDVDQLRKLSATALVLKFSKHTTSKVPKDANTYTYQHQYACTMLPGICSEKFCGNAVDTKPQIKRHLLRHIGELLTMTNQVSPATSFPGSVQSQAKRRMPTTEEIEEIEDLDSPIDADVTNEEPDDGDDNKESTSTKDDKTEVADDSSTPGKVKTVSYEIPSSHQPNKAVTVALPKEVDVRRSSFTVIRSAEGVNEVVLLPKGRLINLSAIQPKSDDENEEEEDGKAEYDKTEKTEDAPDGDQKEDKKKKKFYYPNYNRLRKKGLSKTRAFHMRQSAVRLEIVDDFDGDIDIEDTGDDETDSNGSDNIENKGKEGDASQEEKIETEEVSLGGAFQSPDADSPARHRTNVVPSTSQEIECDIIVRTRKHPANKKPTLPRSVGQSVKSARQLNKVLHGDESKPRNIVAMDPPGDDHNYAWHPTRYISGPTHTDSRGNPLEKPEEKDDKEEKFDLDPIFYPFQPGRSSSSSQKKSKQRRPLTKTIPGVGKVVSHSAGVGNPRWAKGIGREKKETDEEKKMKKKALELLNALHKKQAFKGRKGPFKCQLCGKNVTAAGTLRAHYRSHAGIKPYRCKLCQATFTRLHSLKYHMMIHNQQSRFVCDHCSREFRHASHFREHLRRHTGEEPFGCTDCPARFKTRNTYKRHLFAKHGKLLTADGIQLVPIDS
ncbi:uncharacterized protein [Amphiura filiformis]|uniref:uncharacterized protein n=1 Tax=Amphiura filiformis TaxID=82378 RepID=UPI003B20E471